VGGVGSAVTARKRLVGLPLSKSLALNWWRVRRAKHCCFTIPDRWSSGWAMISSGNSRSDQNQCTRFRCATWWSLSCGRAISAASASLSAPTAPSPASAATRKSNARARPGYLTELPVEYKVETEEFTLQIRGRIDGLLITSGQVLLEEIKTVQGTWDHEADPLHWAQAKFYGFIHAQEHALKETRHSTRVSGIARRQGDRVSPDFFIRRTV
jgi:hypothetical protein